jgi:arginine deiminase
MTANELADAIEKGGKDGFFQDEIIAILRQQQAEIEALHNLVKEQPMRELTDEEIISEWIGNDRNYYNFARAILKKASK